MRILLKPIAFLVYGLVLMCALLLMAIISGISTNIDPNSSSFGNWAMWFGSVGTIGAFILMMYEQNRIRSVQNDATNRDKLTLKVKSLNKDIEIYNTLVLKLNQHKLELKSLFSHTDYFASHLSISNRINDIILRLNGIDSTCEKSTTECEEALCELIDDMTVEQLRDTIIYISGIPKGATNNMPLLGKDFLIDTQLFLTRYYGDYSGNFQRLLNELRAISNPVYTFYFLSLNDNIEDLKALELNGENLRAIRTKINYVLACFISYRMNLSKDIYASENVLLNLQKYSLSLLLDQREQLLLVASNLDLIIETHHMISFSDEEFSSQLNNAVIRERYEQYWASPNKSSSNEE